MPGQEGQVQVHGGHQQAHGVLPDKIQELIDVLGMGCRLDQEGLVAQLQGRT